MTRVEETGKFGQYYYSDLEVKSRTLRSKSLDEKCSWSKVGSSLVDLMSHLLPISTYLFRLGNASDSREIYLSRFYSFFVSKFQKSALQVKSGLQVKSTSTQKSDLNLTKDEIRFISNYSG
jgi:hypothetical protein